MPATRSITWHLFQPSLVRKVVRKPSKSLSLEAGNKILLNRRLFSDDCPCAENHSGWLCTQIPPEFHRTIQCNKGTIPNTQTFGKKLKRIQGKVVWVDYEKKLYT